MKAAADRQAGASLRRPTRPGETRLWCGTCDLRREHPFPTPNELVEHVMKAREDGPSGHTGLPE